jgi:uncharacterized membrane protein
MKGPKHGLTDWQVDQIIGNLLRIGVTTAALVVLAGGLAYLISPPGTTQNFRVFSGEPSELRSVSAIVKGSLALRSTQIIQLGLLMLIITPVARVIFSVVAFALQRDRTYVIVTLIVLSLLLYSILGGRL